MKYADQETLAVKPRVIFDCNIYLQAAVRDTGPAFACMELADAGFVTLIASADTLAEVYAILMRPKIRQKFETLTDKRIQLLMDRWSQIVELVHDVPHHFPYERDPKDEPYINLAISKMPVYLVSRDNDLLALRNAEDDTSRAFRIRYPQITILDPVEFLGEMRRRALKTVDG